MLALTLVFTSDANAHGRKHIKRHPSRPAAVAAFNTKSFIVADSEGHILKEQDSSLVRPIASISKLIVAILVTEQDLNEELDIPTKRTLHSSIPWQVSKLTRKELLTLALVRSDNLATQVLCNNLPNCVERMNTKAEELGMMNTHYAEPTGLSIKNVSTAQDLLKLLTAAATNQTIKELSSKPVAEIVTGKYTIRVRNTNPLTAKYEVIVSKTGFTNPAGGCLIMIMNSSVGQRILILLGSRNVRTRIPDMEKLIKDS